jgi:hypothetical protein
MYSLIATAKLNDVDPRAWLADVLARIADHPVRRLDELLPWNWREARAKTAPPPEPFRRVTRRMDTPNARCAALPLAGKPGSSPVRIVAVNERRPCTR